MCQGPIKQRARAEKCLYKGTTCTPWHIKVLLLFGGGRIGCGRLSGARPGCWWLSVYGHEGRPVTAYTAVWPPVQSRQNRKTDGWAAALAVGSTEEQLSASYWKIRTQKVTGAQLMDDVK